MNCEKITWPAAVAAATASATNAKHLYPQLRFVCFCYSSCTRSPSLFTNLFTRLPICFRILGDFMRLWRHTWMYVHCTLHMQYVHVDQKTTVNNVNPVYCAQTKILFALLSCSFFFVFVFFSFYRSGTNQRPNNEF